MKPTRIGRKMLEAHEIVTSDPGIGIDTLRRRLAPWGKVEQGSGIVANAIAANMLRLDGKQVYALPKEDWSISQPVAAGADTQ